MTFYYHQFIQKSLLIFSILLLAYTPLLSSTRSEYPLHFIEKTLGPAPIAMGRATVARSHNAYDIYSNPALLSSHTHSFFQAMTYTSFESEFFSTEFSTKVLKGTLGVSYLQSSVSSIKETKLNTFSKNYELTGNSFSYLGQAFFLAYSAPVLDTLFLGVTGKYFKESLYGFKSSGFGIDIGALSQLAYQNHPILVGINIQNINQPKLKWNTNSKETTTVPSTLSCGASSSFFDKTLTLSTEIKVTDKKTSSHFGLQYFIHEILPLRIGIDHKQVNFGIGLHLDNVLIDYSLSLRRASEEHYLDNISRFGITLRY